MAGKVVHFGGISRIDSDPQLVLDFAGEAGLKAVLVIGYDANGEEYFGSSYASGPEALWLIERARHRLMQMGDRTDI